MKNKTEQAPGEDPVQAQDLPAGKLSSWLRLTRRAQGATDEISVPCGACTACCQSSYFIHIRPDETQTLDRIPEALLFAAPGLPKGHVLLGYDEYGRCPMFVANKCSIYEHRPRTCRQYDCRIFPATGLSVGEDKALIARQAQRWKFDVDTPRERRQLTALQAAAKFLREHAACFPAGFVPTNATQQAMLAIKVYEVFLEYAYDPEKAEHREQEHEIAAAVIAAYEKFEAGQ